jgi:DNA-binding beta-propeller fold protein YncE
MKLKIGCYITLMITIALGTLQIGPGKAVANPVKKAVTGVPRFEFDPSWPKQDGHFGDKGNWIFGALGGITVDPSNDHVWVIQRPRTLINDETLAAQNPPVSDCCVPAPTVMEFDSAGNYIQGWGGPGPGYEWPESEHGIKIDYRGNVWITGEGKKDNQVLKFTKDGKFLLQIGHAGKSTGSSDTENLNVATNTFVYPKTNEVFVSDGYMNRRVIVFDGDTGAYKRMWGAYGNKPDDTVPRLRRFPFTEGLTPQVLLADPPPQQFNLPHAILISNDGLVYVGDRSNNRVQVFKPDGTYVKEAFVARNMLGPVGTVVDLGFSADSRQQFLYVMSGDEHIRILNRDTLQVKGEFGRLGHLPGQFYHTHAIAVDSKGNIYTAEAATTGRRIEKFVLKGFSSAPNAGH